MRVRPERLGRIVTVLAETESGSSTAELLHKKTIMSGRAGLLKLNSYIKNGRSILRAKFSVRSERI